MSIDAAMEHHRPNGAVASPEVNVAREHASVLAAQFEKNAQLDREQASYDRALDAAYEQIGEQKRSSMNRRVNLAAGMTENSIKILGGLVAALVGAKTLGDTSTAALLMQVVLWLPIFAMIYSVTIAMVANGIWYEQAGYDGQMKAMEELRNNVRGVGSLYYEEVMKGKFWRPSTVETAMMYNFTFWFVVSFASRYYVA